MGEPRLRRELLDITAEQWAELLDQCPSLRAELRPANARRAGARADVDGRTVKRWVAQPQQHRGRLEVTIQRCVQHLLEGPGVGPDQPEDRDGWEDALHRVLDRHGRAAALLCRAYAVCADHDVALPASSPQCAAASDAGEDHAAASAEPDDDATTRALLPDDGFDPALAHARSNAETLATALTAAAGQVARGHVLPDITEPAETWHRTRAALLDRLDLPAADEHGFDGMTERARALDEADRLRREATAAREAEAARAAQERPDLLAQLQKLEETLEGAPPVMRRGLELAREDILTRLAELDGTSPPAGEPARDADVPPVAEVAQEVAPASAVDTHSAASAAPADPPPPPASTAPPVATAVATPPQSDQQERAQSSGCPATGHRPEPAPPGRTSEPPAEPEAPAELPAVPENPTDVDAVLASLTRQGRLAEAYWVQVAARRDPLLGEVLRFAAAAFSTGPQGIDATEVLVEGRQRLSADVLGSDPDCVTVTVAATVRAGLAARWAPFELLDQQLLDRLPEQWAEFMAGLVKALQDGYLHRSGALPRTEDRVTPADVAERAGQLRTELRGAGLTYQRATAVLRHLLRDDEPLGDALTAVEQWAAGGLPTARLAELAGQLTDPRSVARLIEQATRAVSAARQRKDPIIAKARQQLQHRVDQVGQLLVEAVDADAGRRRGTDTSDGHRAELLATLAAQCPPLADGLAGAVLERLRAWVLDPAGDPAPRAAGTTDLLIDASLPLSTAPRDAAGLPDPASLELGATVRTLTDPAPPAVLFEAYLERGDLAAAVRLESDVPHGAERLRDSAEGWIGHLDQQSRTVLGNLAQLPVTVPLEAAERTDFEGRLVGVRTYRGDRYDIVQAELSAVTDELDSLQRSAQGELRTRLDRLPGVDPGDRSRIESLLEDNDLTTAHEFLAFLERGDQLPPEDDDEMQALTEFAPLWRGARAEAMSFDDTLAELGGPQAGDRVDAGIRGWRALPRARTAIDAAKHVRPVLRLLGLELSDLPSSETGRSRPGVFTFVTRNAQPVDGSIVPGLGSRAGRYLIRVIKERMSGAALLDLIPGERRHDANIVLYPGRLTERDRIDLLTAGRRRNVHVVVVDDAVVAYLAQRAPGSFRTMQQVTLPFSAFPHYAPYVAGDVADEVFVGRRREMDEIASPNGSLFVYGGRQLGKSALLRRVERDFNRVPGQHAIFIDLKARGIGEFNQPEHLWVVLLEELKRLGIVRGTFTSAKAEAVVHHIRDWLDEDSGRRLLLLLDEADLFLENEARERRVQNRVARFPNVLQLKGLMDLTNRRFKPVFAGLHQVQRLQNISNSPLAHGGQDILIGPLLQSEARGLVLRPLSALGYRFASPDLVWRLLAVTNYQASLVQIVCFELVEHMTRRRIPARGEPPFVITATDVDGVVTNDEVRNRIAQRFQLTIRLEDRYFVIALTMAVLSLDSRFREDYTAEDLLDWCRMYWPGGFGSLTTEQFRLYLEEMVGLGVMVRRPEHRYAVRSPNVVTMLGSREELEQQLHERADSFDLPHDYNPRVTRRLITHRDRRTERSPLTEQDLAVFFAEGATETPPLVILGNRALGLGHVDAVLRAVAADRGHIITVTAADDLHPVTVRGPHVIERRPIVVVDCSDADGDATQAALLAVGDAHRQKIGRRAVLVGPDGMEAVAQHDPRMLTTIPLARWTAEGLRSWNDNPFASPENREALLRSSGGWPSLVEAAVADAESRATVEGALQRIESFPDDVTSATTFLSDVGLLGSAHLPLVRTWAQVVLDSERVQRPDLADLLDLDTTRLDRLLTTLEWLGVIGQADEAPVLDNVVRRALLLEG